MSLRQEKIENSLQKIIASFAQQHVEAGTIISVTGIDISPDLKNADVLISIFPDNKETITIDNLRNRVGELKRHIKSKFPMKFMPDFEFKIDQREVVRRWAEKEGLEEGREE